VPLHVRRLAVLVGAPVVEPADRVLSKLRGSTGSLPTLTKAKKRSLYSSTSHSSPDGNATSYDGGPYLVAL
jgi:hypothetical protein